MDVLMPCPEGGHCIPLAVPADSTWTSTRSQFRVIPDIPLLWYMGCKINGKAVGQGLISEPAYAIPFSDYFSGFSNIAQTPIPPAVHTEIRPRPEPFWSNS